MMDNYDLVVDVVITKEFSNISKPNYGVACLFSSETPNSSFGTNKTKLYSSIEEVAKDFNTSTVTYKKALAYFSQEPKPTKLRISKRNTTVAQVTELVFSGNLATGHKINGSVNGFTLSETEFLTDELTTLGLIADKIQAISGVSTAVEDAVNNKIVVTALNGYSLDLAGFEVSGTPNLLVTYNTTTAGVTIANDIDEAILQNDDFYGILMTSNSAGDIFSLARRVEASKKTADVCTSSADVKNESINNDIASLLKAAGFGRTASNFHHALNEGLDIATMSQHLNNDPGSYMCCHKNFSGVSTSSLTTSEINALASKNCNFYIPVGGSGNYMWGIMTNGISKEIVRDMDYTNSEIAIGIFSLLKKVKKLPYSKPGIEAVTNQLNNVLGRLLRETVILRFEILPPLLEEISEIDKNAHILPNVRFRAIIARGIKKVLIRGTMV